MAALGAVSMLPVFGLVLFLLPTQSGLALEMLRVRQPALIPRIEALLAIRRDLETALPAGSLGESDDVEPNADRSSRLLVIEAGDLPLTTMAALRPEGDPNAHLAMTEKNWDCRKLRGTPSLPEGMKTESRVREDICEAAILATVDPDALDYLSAGYSTRALNAVLEFDHLAVVRPIIESRPDIDATPPAPGYFSAEVRIYRMNDAEAVRRFMIEATHTDAALKRRGVLEMRRDLGEAARRMLLRKLGVKGLLPPEILTPERLDAARRRAAAQR